MYSAKKHPLVACPDGSGVTGYRSVGGPEAMKEEEECCVIVSSWDGYSDLWKPFFTLFWRYWPDCPFPVFLTANELRYDDRRVQIERFNKELSWSSGLKQCLEKIQSCYILLMLEDFFLRSPVSTTDIIDVLEAQKRLHAHVTRLIPNPRPGSYLNGSQLVGTVKPGRDYRVNLQAAIWRRESLLSILKDGESAWEFEVNGTKRCERIASGFLSVRKPVLTYRHHVIERGKWFRNEAQHFGAMNIGCDFSVREIMTEKEMREWKLHKLKANFLVFILKPIRWFLRYIT